MLTTDLIDSIEKDKLKLIKIHCILQMSLAKKSLSICRML